MNDKLESPNGLDSATDPWTAPSTRKGFLKKAAVAGAGTASVGMLAGQVWIFAKSWLAHPGPYPAVHVARIGDVPIGGVKLFRYPTADDPCILIRPDANTVVAYSQKCTHLSCAVVPRPAEGSFYCPCHEGRFDLRTGAPTAGPPRRPLTRIVLDIRGRDIYAVGVQERTI